MRIGGIRISRVRQGRGRPRRGQVLVKKGTAKTGKQGGRDHREKG